MSKEKPIIMVVEDEKPLLTVIEMKLRSKNFDILTFEGGIEALDYLENAITHNNIVPDVIWLDYYLGDINGLSFVQDLRKMERYKDTPVVVVSNAGVQEKINTMLALGVKKYLLKTSHSLDNIIQNVLNQIN